MRVNPVLAGMTSYPFLRLIEAKRAAIARGVDVIDFGVGEPREVTPAFIPRALEQALADEPVSTYPSAEGLPELREAIAGWAARRFGAALDPATEIIPTQGSKEAIFNFAQVFAAHGDRVVVTAPGYPVAGRGALFAGASVVEAPLDPARGWQPDLDAVDWDGVALLWLNYPNNPTAATATHRALRARRGARARARLRPRRRRGVLRAVVRGRPADQRPAGGRPRERRRAQHALQALVDARLPLGLRGRRPRGHRGAAALPPERRRRAADLHPARRGGRVERRRARDRGPRALPRQARRPAARAARRRPASFRRPRLVLPVAARARGRGRRRLRAAPCSSATASRSRRARSSAPPAKATSASRSSRRPRTVARGRAPSISACRRTPGRPSR